MLRSPTRVFGTRAPPTRRWLISRQGPPIADAIACLVIFLSVPASSGNSVSPAHCSGDGSCASIAPKFQFSTAKYQFVAIFQFEELIATETAAAGYISTIGASQIAHKIVITLFDNLCMSARNPLRAPPQV